MGKLTLRLIKYFIGIITLVIVFCFLSVSIFLSFFYTSMQYNDLKTASNQMYDAMKNGSEYSDVISKYEISSAILLKDGEVNTLTSTKMGTMSIIKNVNLQKLSIKGKYVTPNEEEFLYYNNNTDMGDIILLKRNSFSGEYMRSTYIILAVIFLVALLISIPMVSVLGKKLTKPILKLQNASLDITKGNFNIDVDINTKDEIEDLSKSIKVMAETIEKKNTMQRDFIANVSHDFKTPLSVIRNYSEAIYDDILNEDEKKEFLKDIIKEVDRLNLLVVDILELSKLQGSTDILKKEYFNLSEFLLDFKSAFRMKLEGKNITLNIKSLDSDIEILADGNYLYRIIYNFIDNAIKFSKEDSTVELYVKDEGRDIKISVRDKGIGIDNNYIDDIWKRYYKNKTSGGMGLGLAICSEILDLHNFRYGVISKSGEGAEFFFFIPKEAFKRKSS
ncbi:sensor histidine kinase [Clostridium vincentii]|uniref:histidine kinase n=1 Tax=Clostridium vincentii TaxID=52704 RepID=A0A2T0B6I3_9CLOT|nr:HAMP domain-containing sensor histidine kinase [Clostridium vincentii]PRR79501.1 Alkaline phosphatase synthesis sensor protein PhoR [Clostridium vincentii]